MCQIEETDEARKKFSNAKSISSAQFFGDQNRANDAEAKVVLQKFSVCIRSALIYILSWLFLFMCAPCMPGTCSRFPGWSGYSYLQLISLTFQLPALSLA